MAIRTLAELRETSDAVLIQEHDAKAKGVEVMTSYYVDELSRREQSRFNQALKDQSDQMMKMTEEMRDMTASVKFMTVIITVCTIASTVLTGVAVWLTWLSYTRPIQQ